jgi:hypothetical protein
MQLATHVTASSGTIWLHAALIRFGASWDESLEPEGRSDMTNGDQHAQGLSAGIYSRGLLLSKLMIVACVGVLSIPSRLH